jgi:hypothetical protein
VVALQKKQKKQREKKNFVTSGHAANCEKRSIIEDILYAWKEGKGKL